MSELLLAKVTEYLLHYNYHGIRNLLLDIIFAYGGLKEVLLCGESAEPDVFAVARGGKSYSLLYCYLLALQSEIHFSSHITPFCYYRSEQSSLWTDIITTLILAYGNDA